MPEIWTFAGPALASNPDRRSPSTHLPPKPWILDRFENERHDSSGSAYFPKAGFTLRNVEVIRREDLAEQVGCTPETISRIIHLLKRFVLIETSPFGYVKNPKFNRFARRFARAHEKFGSSRMIVRSSQRDSVV